MIRNLAIAICYNCLNNFQAQIAEAIGYAKGAVSEFFDSLRELQNGTDAEMQQSSENPELDALFSTSENFHVLTLSTYIRIQYTSSQDMLVFLYRGELPRKEVHG